jgi:hypothetical protein
MKIPTPQPSARIWGTVFVPSYSRHDTRNLVVEVVSIFSHTEGGVMVHPQCRECEQ